MMKSLALYKKYAEGHHWEKHPTFYAETFAAFLKEEKFGSLLVDVGCGNGRDVAFFSKLGFTVLGVDKSKEEIEADREKNPGLHFEVQDAEKLKFEDNSVGAFFMIKISFIY